MQGVVERLFINLTPLVPLSFEGEGEFFMEEGAKPPLRLAGINGVD